MNSRVLRQTIKASSLGQSHWILQLVHDIYKQRSIECLRTTPVRPAFCSSQGIGGNRTAVWRSRHHFGYDSDYKKTWTRLICSLALVISATSVLCGCSSKSRTSNLTCIPKPFAYFDWTLVLPGEYDVGQRNLDGYLKGILSLLQQNHEILSRGFSMLSHLDQSPYKDMKYHGGCGASQRFVIRAEATNLSK